MPRLQLLLLVVTLILAGGKGLQAQVDFKGRPPNPPVHVVTAGTPRQPRQIPLSQRVEAAIQQRNLERDNNQLDEAERSYKKALALNPKEPRAYFGLGNVETDHYLTEGVPGGNQAVLQRAINYYHRVVEIDPKEYNAYMALALLHYQSPETYGEVERDLRKAVSSAPENPVPHRELGYFYRFMYRHAESVVEYRIAEKLETDPKNLSTIYYGLLLALGDEGKNEEERAAVGRKWTRIDPQNSYAHQQLGFLLDGQGKYVEAVEELELAVKLKPNEPRRDLIIGVLGAEYYKLGLSYLKDKNKPGAMEQYRKLQALGKKEQAEALLVKINSQ